VQLCQLACGAQVWSAGTMIDGKGEGEDHASSCRWTRNGEGQTLGLEKSND
jgi:hypothetical protein